MSYQTIKVEELDNGTIIRVSLFRPKTLNSLNMVLFQELGSLMHKLNTHETARVVILEGQGKIFSSGIDLKQMTFIFSQSAGEDAARTAIQIEQKIRQFQRHLLNIYECRLPIIVGVHKMCIGAGMDLIAGIDIKYCTKDCLFSIRQIDMGIATDLGSLQFYPKFTGNSSAFKEFAYTGRNFGAEQALKFGFVSKIFENKEEMQNGLLETARSIASKSPVGIYSIKSTLKNGQKDIYENFQFMVKLNGVMIQTSDAFESFSAYIDKRKPNFPKL